MLLSRLADTCSFEYAQGGCSASAPALHHYMASTLQYYNVVHASGRRRAGSACAAHIASSSGQRECPYAAAYRWYCDQTHVMSHRAPCGHARISTNSPRIETATHDSRSSNTPPVCTTSSQTPIRLCGHPRCLKLNTRCRFLVAWSPSAWRHVAQDVVRLTRFTGSCSTYDDAYARAYGSAQAVFAPFPGSCSSVTRQSYQREKVSTKGTPRSATGDGERGLDIM
jgi:hypothetical protein